MSCSEENGKTLYTGNNFSINHFGCGHVGFRFKNVILNFEPDNFMKFSSSFQELIFEERAVTFPDGQARIVINTCRREIQLCFNQSEFETVKDGLREAALMLEISDILYSGSAN